MSNCIGPFLPLEELEDPAGARARFANLLEARESSPLTPDMLGALSLEPRPGEPGQRASALLDVKASAPFFADHFPRKPVLPATILLELHVQMACDLARVALGREPDARVTETCLRGLKIRQFTPPGTVLSLEANVTSAAGDEVELSLTMRRAPTGEGAGEASPGRPLGTAKLTAVLEDGT
jgi:3-hydroxymyristoyl/3-hydroxydecanoyl-(acyl carrier protein) dehydratase